MDDNSSVKNRSPLEIAHFALGAAGFFIGAGGIVLACPAVALTGAFMIGWCLLFFVINS